MPSRRVLLIIAVVTLALGAGGWFVMQKLMPAKASAGVLDPGQAHLAEAFLDLLDAGRYGDALAMTTPRMQEGLGNGKLESTWEALPKQLGARNARSAVRGEVVNGASIVTSTLSFAMLPLDARISFDAENKIGGFWIVPAQVATEVHEPESTATWREIEFPVGEGKYALPGSLTLPRGGEPFAAVVLVHGSGAHDRDSTLGPNKPLRDLAHGLAAHGIAVLRYEKRTKVHPEQFADGKFTVDEETVNDALLATAALRARSDIDATRVFVAGHSLGAMMAPRIGERDPKIAGLILLAAPALRLEDTVVRQMRWLYALDSQGSSEAMATISQLERQRDVIKKLSTTTPVGEPLMLNLPASYWRDLNTYDPIVSAGAITQPMLILQG